MHGISKVDSATAVRIVRLWAGGSSQGGMSMVLIAERFQLAPSYVREIILRGVEYDVMTHTNSCRG